MTEEEERDFETFTLASRNTRRGKVLMEGLSGEYEVLFSGPAGTPSG